MVHTFGRLARMGTAAAVFLLALVLLQWGPVHAEPPAVLAGLTSSGLVLFGWGVGLAVLAALCGGPPPRPSPRGVLIVALATSLALALVVAVRPPAGLPASVREGEGASLASLSPGPVDVVGPDLQSLPRLRRPRLSWQGELRAPATGTYVLWAEGRGHVVVELDGWPVLEGEGDPLRSRARVPLVRGPHAMRVLLERDAPGARLRLGWALPGREGSRHVIPPRALGPPIGAAWWWLTDALALALAGLAAALVAVLPWDVRRPLPSAQAMVGRQVAASTAGYAVVLAVMSWPLVTDPAHLGVTDRPDGRLNAWILAWDVHALSTAPGRLFDAPAFHPLPDALAFSENLLVPALLAAPFQWLGGPVLAYNAALLLSLLISGLGVEALVRRVTGDRLAAFVAGALFAAGAHRWIRLAHLHAQVTLFLPFALLALDRFWAERRLRQALLMGVLLALQGLSSIYLGAITALFLAAAILVMLVAGLRGRDVVKLGAGLGLAAILLLPWVRPYLRMRAFQGVEFTLDDVRQYATTLESYAASGTRLYGGLTQRHLDPERVQDTLFPGVVTLGLGLAGLAVAPRRYRAAAVLASALAIAFSLGPATSVYRFLHEHLVLVRGVRALSRFSLIPVLCLCVLAGLFLAGRRRAVALLALALALLESTQAPMRFDRWEGPSPAARWLAGREGAVVVLPAGDDDTAAMLDGTAHWRPLVNGDSGFVPRPYARVLELMDAPFAADSLRLLRAVGVRHLVSPVEAPLPEAARFDSRRIFELPNGAQAEVVTAGQPAATSWRVQGIALDLGAPREVSRIVFEVSDAPWVARPRLHASLDGAAFETVEAVASLADATLSLLRDPRHGRGEIVFPPRRARVLRVDPRLPARPGALEVGS